MCLCLCVCVAVCIRQHFLWCESVNHVLCWQCKVQNSPVCNKTELRVQNRHSSAFQGFCSTRGLDKCVPAHTLAQTSLSSCRKALKHAQKWSLTLETIFVIWTLACWTDNGRESWWRKVQRLLSKCHVQPGYSMTRHTITSMDYTWCLLIVSWRFHKCEWYRC